MQRVQNNFVILQNKRLSDRYFRLSLDAPQIIKKIQPGQFIHIRVSDGMAPFFRRPFSVHRAKTSLDIFYEVVGPGTEILSRKKKGEQLDVLGPLGNAFVLPPKGVKQIVMVAGGIGVAPFLLLTDVLKGKGYDLLLLYGGRTEGHTFDMKEFVRNGCRVFVSTDDGSVGVKGRVLRLFSNIALNPAGTFLYTCGPSPMMASVQAFAREQGLKGQASCEEVMACGLGACLGCATKTHAGYKTVCYDGPVFDLDQIIF